MKTLQLMMTLDDINIIFINQRCLMRVMLTTTEIQSKDRGEDHDYGDAIDEMIE